MAINNVLLVVDTKNLFNSLHKTYGNGKLDYQKYYEIAGDKDHIYSGIAYGQQSENSSVNFITFLNRLGFICKFKQIIKTANKTYYCDSNVQLTIDVCTQLAEGKIDHVVIGSSDAELVDLVNYIRSRGYPVTIYACRIPKVLRDVASSCIDLDDQLLLK